MCTVYVLYWIIVLSINFVSNQLESENSLICFGNRISPPCFIPLFLSCYRSCKSFSVILCGWRSFFSSFTFIPLYFVCSATLFSTLYHSLSCFFFSLSIFPTSLFPLLRYSPLFSFSQLTYLHSCSPSQKICASTHSLTSGTLQLKKTQLLGCSASFMKPLPQRRHLKGLNCSTLDPCFPLLKGILASRVALSIEPLYCLPWSACLFVSNCFLSIYITFSRCITYSEYFFPLTYLVQLQTIFIH